MRRRQFLSPPAPYLQDVVVSLKVSLAAPQREYRAPYAPARLEVFGVVGEVYGGGAVVLAGGVDGLRLAQAAKAPCTKTTVGRDPSCGFVLIVFPPSVSLFRSSQQ
jgi:hypothetical protein